MLVNKKNHIIKKLLTFILMLISSFFLSYSYELYHNNTNKIKYTKAYQQMIDAYKKKDFISMSYHARNINTNYKEFNNISKLFLSKYTFIQNKYKLTKFYLESLKYGQHEKITKDIINKRLIQIYIVKKNWKKAFIMLRFYKNIDNLLLYEEIKGDLYMKVNEYKKAKKSYKKAKENNNSSIMLDLKIKYLNNI